MTARIMKKKKLMTACHRQQQQQHKKTMQQQEQQEQCKQEYNTTIQHDVEPTYGFDAGGGYHLEFVQHEPRIQKFLAIFCLHHQVWMMMTVAVSCCCDTTKR